MGSQLIPALTLAYVLKQAKHNLHISIGGASINCTTKESLERIGKLSYIDSIAHFGGGETLTKLIESVSNNVAINKISNVIDCTDQQPVFPENYKIPDIHDENQYFFDKKMLSFYPTGYYLPVLYSQGCYWGKCVFCSYVEQFSNTYQIKRVEEFVDAIEALSKKFKNNRFTFIGECLPPLYAERVADEIIKRKLKLRFWTYIRVDEKFNQRIFDKLALAGCNKVTIGAESTNDRILEFINKGYSRELIFKIIKQIHYAGIEAKFNIIWDLPGTKPNDVLGILRDVIQLKKFINRLTVFNFSLEKESRMGRSPENYGIELTDKLYESSAMLTNKFFYNELMYIDKKGMNRRQKKRFLPLFRQLASEIAFRETKKEYMTGDLLQYKWKELYAFINKYVVLLGDKNKFYCFHLLKERVENIDEVTFYYLKWFTEKNLKDLSDLVKRVADKKGKSEVLIKKELKHIIDKYIKL